MQVEEVVHVNGASTLVEIVNTPEKKKSSPFGNRLKKARKLAGWSQSKLGVKLGLAQSAVSSIESGDKVPSEKVKAIVLKLWGVK